MQNGTGGGSAARLPDSRSFFYTRYPQGDKRPPADRDVYMQLYHHTLGTRSASFTPASAPLATIHFHNESRPSDDPYWTKADWRDASILSAPTNWGRGIAGGKLPPNTSHMDPVKGTPLEWPIRFTLTHWAALLPGLPAGKYDLCCRTIDHNGIAQPLPRPFPRSGNNAIHRVTLTVKA